MTTAYRLQSDGQTERQSQSLEHCLRSYAHFEQDDRARWIPLAQAVLSNGSKHSTTGLAPSQMLLGFHSNVRLDPDVELKSHNKTAEQRTKKKIAAARGRRYEILEEENLGLRPRIQIIHSPSGPASDDPERRSAQMMLDVVDSLEGAKSPDKGRPRLTASLTKGVELFRPIMHDHPLLQPPAAWTGWSPRPAHDMLRPLCRRRARTPQLL